MLKQYRNLFIGGTDKERQEASSICHEEAKKRGFNEWHDWWRSEDQRSDGEAFKFICEVGNKYDKKI